jgi:signal transduction histidine kinase
MKIKIAWLWIIAVVVIITAFSIIITWQAQSISESFTNSEIIIANPVEVNETEIKKHPGAPMKNASEEVKQEFSNSSD